MNPAPKKKVILFIFLLALAVRLSFYLLAERFLPGNFMKFSTADTKFYYDPFAMQMTKNSFTAIDLLSATRFTFLGYLAIFYHYFGHTHLPLSIFHCSLSAASAFFLYLTARLFLPQKAATITAGVAIFNPVILYWAPFVTTETLFLFLLSVCIFLCALWIKNKNLAYLLLLLLFLAIICVSRPLGITFSLFSLIYLAWLVIRKAVPEKTRVYFVIFLAVCIGFSSLFLISQTKKIDEILSQSYPQELLQLSLYLDQMPQAEVNRGHLRVYGARLTVPQFFSIPKADMSKSKILSADIISYFRKHWDKYFTLMILKVYTLFNPWVPEYSFRHNVFNLVFYSLIYIFSLIGLIGLFRKEHDFTVFIIMAIFSQVFLVALTLVDYDFRFRLPVEFILALPVGLGLYRLLNSLHKGST